jgi:hypothetical protein
MGHKRVRANSPLRFSLGRRQRTRFDFRPGGLGKTEALSFHGLPLAKPEGLRPGGRKQAVTNRGVQQSPSVLPYTFGVPVSGGEGFRRTVIESDSLCPDGTLQGGRVALTIKAMRNRAGRNKCS